MTILWVTFPVISESDREILILPLSGDNARPMDSEKMLPLARPKDSSFPSDKRLSKISSQTIVVLTFSFLYGII